MQSNRQQRFARQFLAVSAAYLLGSAPAFATPRSVDVQDVPMASGVSEPADAPAHQGLLLRDGGAAVQVRDLDTLATTRHRHYGGMAVDPQDVTTTLEVFPEPIFAATGDVAFGNGTLHDAHSATLRQALPFATTMYGVSPTGSDFSA